MQSLAERLAADIEAKLPSDNSPTEKAILLAEFDRGRNHILTIFVLQNSYMMEEPDVVFAIGSPDEALAKEAVKLCLPCSSTRLSSASAPRKDTAARHMRSSWLSAYDAESEGGRVLNM